MKIATWNVNSIRARLEPVLAFLEQEQPDCLALQETKSPDPLFPMEAFLALGYHCLFTGEKSYNGLALITKKPIAVYLKELPGDCGVERRFLSAQYDALRIVNIYVPNGQSLDSDKYRYKLAWLSSLNTYLSALRAQGEKILVLGDFNIAPSDVDVYDPAVWKDCVLVSQAEREAFQALIDLGFVDLYRALNPADQAFSWWDYRQAAFRRNMGLRIDHILGTANLLDACERIWIDKSWRGLERPSDHTPVILSLSL